jgi:hypothetical protein
MIRYLRHNEIDKAGWDKCIREAFNGNLYAWSWYLDVVHPEWEALVEDNYTRVFPLTGNTKFGISYLFQPFFAQQLGIYSKSLLNAAVIGRFMAAIPSHYRFVDIRLNTHNKVEAKIGLVKRHRNHELDLIPTYDKIHAKYSTNTKRNLKKSLEAGLSLTRSTRPEDIITLFRRNRGRTISHWNDLEYARLLNLTNTAVYRGQASIYGVVTAKNELCAGAIFMKSHNKIVFLFSGTNKTALENQALTYLIDSVIRESAPSQFILDFEGSDNDGLARFYKGFGSQQTHYPGVVINRLPWILRIGMNIIKRRKKH